ncbi:MAG: hypothetical protein ACNS62_16220 [Candidatus Cyclobacteriaceae bacterium M3_2C_046]
MKDICLEKPKVITETFKEKGYQKVEIWKDRSNGFYYAIAINEVPPVNCSFIGMTNLMVE